MSKKQLHSRLETLFSNFEDSALPLPQGNSAVLQSWSWECDATGRYVSVSPHVEAALGIPAASFTGHSLTAFAIAPESAKSAKALLTAAEYPVEAEIVFLAMSDRRVHVRMHLFSNPAPKGDQAGYHGYAEIVSVTDEPAPPNKPLPVAAPHKENSYPTGLPGRQPAITHTGALVWKDPLTHATQWTSAVSESLSSQKTVARPSGTSTPAVIAAPLNLRDNGIAVVEILDEKGVRKWNEDERLLVEEVLGQLSIALENAELYSTVEQELRERIRAEQEILQRNKDLATLNQIGQQLSRLAGQTEIFALISRALGEVVDSRNFTLAIFNRESNTISFPIHMRNGQPLPAAERSLGSGMVDHVIRSQSALLLNKDVELELRQRQVLVPYPAPQAILAVPMIAGERVNGVILLQNYEDAETFKPIHLELVSTIASQAATALENANLFQGIRTALEAIENRERYQAGVARAIASLAEQGYKSLASVVEELGTASRSSRVYYVEFWDEGDDSFWRPAFLWSAPGLPAPFGSSQNTILPMSNYRQLAEQLRDKSSLLLDGKDLLTSGLMDSDQPKSLLLVAVRGKTPLPGFIAFEQTNYERRWSSDEINILRVAADAVSNMTIRDDLFEQVQSSLAESENLYTASHSLALATDAQEMVSAVVEGFHTPGITRATLLTFEYDLAGSVSSMTVAANWYSGSLTPPAAVGSHVSAQDFAPIFLTSFPLFMDDIHNAALETTQQQMLEELNIRSLAVLPLWSGKRQMGSLLIEAEKHHHFNAQEMRSLPPLVDQMATALENKRLFDQTQLALSETEMLYRISNGVARAANPHDLVQLVAQYARPHNADRISLVMIHQNLEGQPADLEIVGFYDASGLYERVGTRIPFEALPMLRNLTSEPIIMGDLDRFETDPSSKAVMRRLNIASGILSPMFSGGRLVGLLTATNSAAAQFTTDEGRLLQISGNSIAVALERLRLFQEAQRRALELQTAAELARDTTSTLTLDNLLAQVVNLLCERFGFYHASIFLLDDSNTYAVVRESTGEAGRDLKARNHRLAVGSKSIIGTVTATGAPLIVNDVITSAHYYPNPMLPKTRSEMGVPLKIGDHIIGAIDIQAVDLNAFSSDDVAVMQILSDQVAIAIQNARAFALSQKAFEEMREADRVKTQFLANMSHELRTPLNSIIGFSRIIMKGIDGPVNETQHQDLSAIYNSGQHLLSLINNILDLSKLEAGKMEMQFMDVNMNDIINSVMSTATGLVKEKPIRLINKANPALPIVKGDVTRIRQIMLNLVSNAAKFTEEGTITIDGQVQASPQGKPELIISVTDTGPGIADADRGKLFLPFSQVDDSPTRKTGGTGLGLSISRQLIEKHGGRIGLAENTGQTGCTFYFTLPLELPAEPTTDDQPVHGSTVILCIDDDPQVISLYERYLKPQGYTVVPLSKPCEAVEKACAVRPFAITLDVMMPERDGWQVLHDLKNDPATKDIPVVICSILEEEEKGFSLGAADYLVKPFLSEELINSINRLNSDGSIREILVIDDDEADLRLVQKTIEENSAYHITPVQGGQAGLEILDSFTPDAIILDLFMPDKDGFSILEKLRTRPKLRSIPVIVLTGADLTPEQHKLLADFGSQILTKSMLREKELLAVLEETLRRVQPHKQPAHP